VGSGVTTTVGGGIVGGAGLLNQLVIFPVTSIAAPIEIAISTTTTPIIPTISPVLLFFCPSGGGGGGCWYCPCW